MRPRTFLLAAVVLVGFCQYGLGADLKLLLLDSRTAKPLGRKSVCVSFSRNPKMTALDRPDIPEVCKRTDSTGSTTFALPDDSAEWTYVRVLTNDFVPCFDIPLRFFTAELTKAGAIAPNTCGPADTNLTTEPGRLIFYGHQMTFRQVLKSMWHEV